MESIPHASAPKQNDLIQVGDLLAFLGFTWRHKFRIALILILAGALAATYYTRAARVYEAEAEILVSKINPRALEGPSDEGNQSDNMLAHVALIESPWLAERVLDDPEIANLPTLFDQRDPVGFVSRAVTATHHDPQTASGTNTNVLSIALAGPNPDDTIVILDAVIVAYQEYLADSKRAVNEEARVLIAAKKAELDRKLSESEKRYELFHQNIRVLTGHEDNLTSIRTALSNIKQMRLANAAERASLETTRDEWNKLLRSGKKIDPLTLRALRTDDDHANRSSLEQMLVPLIVEERTTLQEFGPNHPYAKEKIATAQATRELFSHAAGLLEIEQDLKAIDAAEAKLQEEEAELNRQMLVELDREKKFLELQFQDEKLKEDIARDETYRNALVSQMLSVDLGMVTGGYQTTVIEPPVSSRQVSPNIVMIGAIALMLGMLGGFVYAVAAELSDRTFRSTHEVTQSLHVPVLGQMPEPSVSTASRNGAGDSRTLRSELLPMTEALPDSAAAEAYRGLRNALLLQASDEDLRVIQVASPNAGDGKTTLAVNLAASIARSGKQVLLIDADLHAPRIHTMFGITDDDGLACVLAGRCRLDEVIQPSGIDGLSLLPCGPRPTSPGDLLTSARLREVLADIREEFDFVLIDTPALLSTSDSQIVAANSDGVLLTVRSQKNERPSAARATEILRFTGARILGVVLNGTNGRGRSYVAHQPGSDYEELSPTIASSDAW